MLGLFRAAAAAIQALLDVVLPRKERTVRVDRYRVEDVPVFPTEHEACGVPITTLLAYREPIVEDLIRAVKYDGSSYASTLLAEILAEYLREEISAIRAFSVRPVILVPLPLYPTREVERGFNQIRLILDRLPAEFRDGSLARVEHDVLVRVRETAPQTRLPRIKRLTNVKGAFALSDVATVIDAHAFVIDDVTTTGATLAEAVRPLLNIGIPATALALARA